MLQRFYADWETRRRGREFPARRDFDPWDLRYALGYISLLDVLRDPLRFRFRLQGVGIAERIGMDMTGKFVEAMPDRRHYHMAMEHYSAVIEARGPAVRMRRAYVTDARVWNCEVLAVPLSNNGADIDMLMSCLAWDEGGAPKYSAVPIDAGFDGRT